MFLHKETKVLLSQLMRAALKLSSSHMLYTHVLPLPISVKLDGLLLCEQIILRIYRKCILEMET